MEYTVKTPSFEGPLGLLLSLIERRKLFISDISLADIADDYIEFVRNRGDISIRESTDFISIASALMLIKSKSLLPNLSLTLEEEQSIEDLEERLKIYKKIKDLSVHIEERFGKKIMFAKNYNRRTEPIFSPDKNINIQSVFASVIDVLTKVPKKEIVSEKSIKKVISLEEMIDNFTERVKKNIQMKFSDFVGKDKKEKVYIVVSFLAMLELVKQNVVSVRQAVVFGEIDIESREIDVPRY